MVLYSLTRALRLDTFTDKPLVCFVGGGGKTTAMFTLADELAAQGKRVVTTTTTRLFAGQRDQSPAWCHAGDESALLEHLDVWGQCLVVGDGEGVDMVGGLFAEQVAALHAHAEVDAVLVEADGSRSRPFKAPAAHEPVIPRGATHVVALVGADVLGKPLDAAHVHRPERVATVGGVAEGTPVTPDLLARVLTHQQGALQNVPEGSTFVPFLNKVENPADLLGAEETARRLLEAPRVRDVLLGSLHTLRAARHLATDDRTLTHKPAVHTSSPTPHAPLSVRARAAAVVLAAGMATRFGETKQLLRWQGQALVAHAAEVALAVCDTVLVVVGHEAETVARAVEHLPVEVVFNPHFPSGQGSSVAAGVAALGQGSRPFIGEAFFLLADQPRVTPELLRQLQAVRGFRRIALPRHAGQRGSPTLWDAALFPALAQSTGEAGGRALFDEFHDDIAWLDVAEAGTLADADTPEEWAALLSEP